MEQGFYGRIDRLSYTGNDICADREDDAALIHFAVQRISKITQENMIG